MSIYESALSPKKEVAAARIIIKQQQEKIDFLQKQVHLLEMAIKGDCAFCANIQNCGKYPCYCINGNAWLFDDAQFLKVGEQYK